MKYLIPTCFAFAALSAGAAEPAAEAASKPLLNAESVNRPGAPATGKPERSATLRAQILLDRAGFSPGEIDAGWGSNTRKALLGFQRARKLATSGTLDSATWEALNADQGAALVAYKISAADLAGPFVAIPKEMADKAKLSALGHESALEALGEQFHASPTLLTTLNPNRELGAGTEIMVPNVRNTEPLPKADKIVVDQSEGSLTLLDAAGKVLAQYPVTTGSEHDPLPIGAWKVNGVAKNPVFHYNPKLFWDAQASEERAKIPPGPNNPVGVAWIDLSKPHYGIHGTPVPSTIGKTASHGCIRMTNWDVLELSESVGPGTSVVLQQ